MYNMLILFVFNVKLIKPEPNCGSGGSRRLKIECAIKIWLKLLNNRKNVIKQYDNIVHKNNNSAIN